jgi:HEPN domain-containing protein
MNQAASYKRIKKMDDEEIKAKILKDLEEEPKQQDPEELLKKLSRKYDVPKDVMKRTIAEWSAGK